MPQFMLFKMEDANEVVEEYQALLDQLDEEAEGIKVQDEENEKRLKGIKKQVGDILDKVGAPNIRVAVEVKSGRAWDRRISLRGAGLDPTLLEEAMGTAAYRRLCIRTVAYVLDPMKLEAARVAGKLIDKVLNKATLKGAPSPSYYRPKMEDVNDGS